MSAVGDALDLDVNCFLGFRGDIECLPYHVTLVGVLVDTETVCQIVVGYVG
jgi:hypothetical protein